VNFVLIPPPFEKVYTSNEKAHYEPTKEPINKPEFLVPLSYFWMSVISAWVWGFVKN
jgi:hypothetical protein